MQYESTTTLSRIREEGPCEDGWKKLRKHLGPDFAMDAPLALMTVLDSNGLDDALWVLSYAMPDDRLARHFQAWCAEQVLHLFEAERPDDSRVRDQIAMLRRDDATTEERAAAGDAAGDAAWAAARAAWDDAQAAGDAGAARAAQAAGDSGAARAAWAAQAAGDAGAAHEKQLRLMLEGKS